MALSQLPVPRRSDVATSNRRIKLLREAVNGWSTGSNQPQPAHRRTGSTASKGAIAPEREGAVATSVESHSPRPLFTPSTLIIGDSITRNIRYFNAITRSFPGATVTDILRRMPDLLCSLPSTITRIIVHVGTNDTALQQSEVTKRDFIDLFSFLLDTGKTVFVSGPIPTLTRGSTRFSRILALNIWLQSTSHKFRFGFIDNFNLFWNRPSFYRHDGLHPSPLGNSILTANIQHTVHCVKFDLLLAQKTHPEPSPPPQIPPIPLSSPVTFPIPSIVSNRPFTHPKPWSRNYNNLKSVHIQKPSIPQQLNSSKCFPELNLNVNVRSLSSKSFLIRDLILDQNLNGLFLTETWNSAAPILLSEATPPHFNFTNKDRKQGRGGGTAAILDASISFKEIVFNAYTSFEYQTIVFNNSVILCLIVYRPPKYNSTFIADFSELLSLVYVDFSKIMILGDLNLHIDDLSDNYAQEFLNVLVNMNFTQHVNVPTHNRGHILDLLITHGLQVSVTSVVDVGLSDHFLLSFKLSEYVIKKLPNRTIRRRCLNPEVTANFSTHLENEQPNIICRLINTAF
uniref:SGNH hydrolase-type esterase domain-containing protein n=1 Tax=Oryzias melastigma TaxID=30732 RepID=A0A3B3DLX2_ORYME